MQCSRNPGRLAASQGSEAPPGAANEGTAPLASGRCGEWTVHYPAGLPAADACELARQVPGLSGEVLRDDHRSLVKRVRHPAGELLCKQPRHKDHRIWPRINTLWRAGEARALLEGMLVLGTLGLPTTVPLLAMERRRLGAIVESWLVYRYRPGRCIGTDDYPQVVALLRRLHEAGYRHGDAHIDNFLHDGAGAFMIDCKPRRNRYGSFGQYNDFVYLQRRYEQVLDIEQCYDFDTSAVGYRVVRWYRRYRRVRRSVKSKLRRSLGWKRKTGRYPP